MCRDEEVSKDLTQEVFYKMIKHRNTYKYTRFSSWVYTIARNLCKDHYQRSNKIQKQLNEFQYVNQSSPTVEHPIGNETQLRAALEQLSPADRELIIMSKFQKMKYQEIAEIVGSTVGAVKTKTHRAIGKLRLQYFKMSKQNEL